MAKSFSKAFYNSSAWKNMRAYILRRDLYTCQDCMAARAEHVHHEVTLDESNIDKPEIALNPDLLTSLCKSCHDKRTKGVSDIVAGFCFDDKGYPVPINNNNKRKE